MNKVFFDSVNLRTLRKWIDSAHNVVITCHLSPDGDAMGSSLALAHVLTQIGKTATVITPDMPTRSLMFLPGAKWILTFSQIPDRAKRIIDQADLIFCLDFNTIHRVDAMAETISAAHGHKVLIDHHLGPEDFCDIVFSYPAMSSTCELLYRIIEQIGLSQFVSRDAASCIYAGMMTDTGNFTYNSTDPYIYTILSKLVALGIPKESIYNKAMNTFSADCLRIKGYAISEKMQLYPNLGGAMISLTKEELTKFNYRKGDTEGLVNMPLSIPGINWVFFFREDDDHIKISSRSRGDIAVNLVCEHFFNGGGHKNAAGGDYFKSMDELIELFNNEILNTVNNYK